MKLSKLSMALIMLGVALPSYSQMEVVGVSSVKKGSSETSVTPESSRSYTMLAPGKYEGVYEYSICTADKNGDPVTDIYTTILQISDNCAKFSDYTAYLTDSLAASGADSEAIAQSQMREYSTEFYFVPEIVLNMPDGQITVQDVNGITTAVYTEPFASMDWILTEETDSVSGYLCTKAVARYGGRDWEAWCTDEIASPFGPWKLSGLPGLIIKASDGDGIHNFVLTGFRRSEVPVMKTNDSRAVEIDRAKFIAVHNKTGNNPMGAIDPASITSVTVRKDIGGNSGSMLVNGIQVRKPVNIFVPLELE